LDLGFYIAEDGFLHSHYRENVKPYIALTCCALWRRCNISPVRYKLGSFIPENGILHSHRREKLKTYKSYRIQMMQLGIQSIKRWE
jgi:hypothetical protein